MYTGYTGMHGHIKVIKYYICHSDSQGDPALRDHVSSPWAHVCGSHWRWKDYYI